MLRVVRGTIVCGVTAAPDAREAAQLAGALAGRLGLRLVLVHVVEPHERDGDVRPFESLPGPPAAGTELRVVHGNPVDSLARVAADERADLIVLGSRAHGARGRLLRCGLASGLEAAQSVPVVVAPPATRRPRPALRPAG